MHLVPSRGYANEDLNMVSSRAAEVAEVLWELKRAGKLATFSSIATRAGFSAGTNGRTVQTALRTVRRDWPHLQWWRAVTDDGTIEKGSEHEERLREGGFDMQPVKGKENSIALAQLEEYLMSWDAEAGSAAKEAAST
jgi:alkylated DNA nucleotide flippase Atl1